MAGVKDVKLSGKSVTFTCPEGVDQAAVAKALKSSNFTVDKFEVKP